uniref:Uncharacterized protein n=1 Tax=Pristionchus pacificus TaxID=54126 RepID=A0A8R1YG04_PRIPA
MFESTVEAAELFSKALKCSNCQTINDNLQMCGDSCKHPFCWDCINKFMRSDTFVLCPVCKLPLELNRPTNCYLFNNLSALLSDLRTALTKKSHEENMGSAETQHILFALEHQTGRGIDDFCSQQVCDDLPSTSSTPANFQNISEGFERDSPIEQKKHPMQKDANFFIETAGLVNIGNPVDHSTQKDVPDLFASQAIAEWNPCGTGGSYRSVPPISKGKSVPKEWIEERERRSGTALKRSSTEIVRRSSNRLSNEKEKDEVPKTLNSSFMFDEEDDILMDMSMKAHEKKREKQEESIEKNIAEKKKIDNHPKKKSLGGKKGESVLINSIILKNEKKLKEALESGWDANERDPDGKTAIFMAAERDLPHICLALIAKGAAVNAYCGEWCQTPLHAAASSDSFEAAKVLIEKGASRRAKDLRGDTPDMVAKSDKMKLLITRHSSVPLQIVYPLRKSRILFLHDGIDPKLKRIADSDYDVVNSLEEANILVVEGKMGRATTLNVNILESIARGMTIVTEDWLSTGGDERKFEVKSIKNGDDCEYEGGCIASRKNSERLMPPLFYGISFYLCHSKYGTITKNEYIEIIKAGGGKVLSREPVSNLEELSPFHARQLSPYFVLFNPVIPVPDKLSTNLLLNLVSYNWLQESLARFEFIQPY